MAQETTDGEKRLSSAELERLMLRRRRQEAVEGLRLLSPLHAEPGVPAEMESLERTGLTPPDALPVPAKAVAAAFAGQMPPGEILVPDEEWLSRPRVRLKPAQSPRRPRRRRAYPLLAALRKGVAKAVDTLIVLVLILFVFALGFWIYDNYLAPLLNPDGPTARAQTGGSMWSGQGWLTSTEEYVPNAPLPFIPYSTTVTLEDPYIPVPTPAPGTVVPTRLAIPSIQVDAAVVEVTIENGVWQVAKFAVGYHRGTARPGTVGNTVISGHNGMYGAVFARLIELKPGDEVLLYAKPRVYRYIVEEKKSVWPHQVEVMAQTSTPILTLITCTAYDTQRLVVVARFDREILAGSGSGP